VGTLIGVTVERYAPGVWKALSVSGRVNEWVPLVARQEGRTWPIGYGTTFHRRTAMVAASKAACGGKAVTTDRESR